MSNLNKNLTKSIEKINVQNLEAKTRDSTLEKEVRNQYQRISARFYDLEERQEEATKRSEDQILKSLGINKFHQEEKITSVLDNQKKMIKAQENLQQAMKSSGVNIGKLNVSDAARKTTSKFHPPSSDR